MIFWDKSEDDEKKEDSDRLNYFITVVPRFKRTDIGLS